MCLMVFGYRCHPRYSLILASNRDEYYDRPSLPARFWKEKPEILAGRDLHGGGTWLGISRLGKFAAVTNYRDPGNYRKGVPTRGELVTEFLFSRQSPESFLRHVDMKSSKYNGFNLLVGDLSSLFYYSNQTRSIQQVFSGIHGLSNHLLDTPWLKVKVAKERFKGLLKEDHTDPESLFRLLADPTQAPQEELPHTGVEPQIEKALSSIFIKTPIYGTRSSSLVFFEKNRIFFYERSFDKEKGPTKTENFEIVLSEEKP